MCRTSTTGPSDPAAERQPDAVRRRHRQRAQQGECGGRGQDRPGGAFGVRLVLSEEQAPLGRRGLGAQAEEAQGGEGQGDAGEAEQGVAGHGRQDGGEEFVAEKVERAGAQGAGGEQVRRGALLAEEC